MIEEKIGTELDVISGKKFQDLDEFAQYYYAITLIEKKVKAVKEAIKKQGNGMMFDSQDDITRLDYNNFSIVKQASSESISYNPKQVFEVISEIIEEEFVWTLLESKNAKINELLSSWILTGAITADQVNRLKSKASVKRRSGFLTLREKKENKLLC